MALAGFILCSLEMWPYADVKNAPEERWGLAAHELYFAFSRPAWGVGLSLLTFSLVYETDQGMVIHIVQCDHVL